MHFLCVDDDDGDQYILKRFLEPYCESFTTAKSLREALRLCEERQFTTAILDLNLTDSNWRSTLAEISHIRKLQPKMRIIVCSGVPVQDLKEQALDAGADVMVAKDQNLYRDSAKALLIAVNVAMLHATPDDDFWPRVRALREMVEHISKE